MKLSKDSPVIKRNVKKRDWKFAKENATKVAICVTCEIGSDGSLYHDIVAEYEYEEFLKIRNELKKEFGPNGYWTIGGYELGFLYPMQVYYDKKTLAESFLLFHLVGCQV